MAAIAAEELGVPLGLRARGLGGHRSHAGRPRRLLEPGDVHGRQRCPAWRARPGRHRRAAVAAAWGIEPDAVRLAGGWALEAVGDPARRRMPIAEAFQLAETANGTLGAIGHYDTPKDVHGDYRGGTIGASPAYSFTAHVAEVDVDPDTGFVEVKTIWVAHDCGQALNPVLVEGQMEGSAYMGFGEALMERSS